MAVSAPSPQKREPEASQPGLLDTLFPLELIGKHTLKHVRICVYLKRDVGFIRDRFGMLGRLLFKTLKKNRKENS